MVLYVELMRVSKTLVILCYVTITSNVFDLEMMKHETLDESSVSVVVKGKLTDVTNMSHNM